MAAGIVLALVMVGNGGWIGGHQTVRPEPDDRAPLPHEVYRMPAPAGRTSAGGAAEEFPLIKVGTTASPSSLVSAAPVVAPLPPEAPADRGALRQSSPAPPFAESSADLSGGHYVVQLGTYRHEENARQDQARYRGLGIDAQVRSVGAYVVLRLPPSPTLAAAQQMEREVRARGIQPLVIGPLR